jgi:Helix-turn-helix domain
MFTQIAGALVRVQKPKHREKMFGEGRAQPLDRNAKARVLAFARALTHRTEKGKHYGKLTDKFLTVLRVLLWDFHNAASGRCFPSYESIAERAYCGRTTVYQAIHALEAAGILTWVNRIARIREWGPDLFGCAQNRWRVIRTSNQYCFVDPKTSAPPPGASKFKFQTGTAGQVSKKEKNGSDDALCGDFCASQTGQGMLFDNYDEALAAKRRMQWTMAQNAMR